MAGYSALQRRLLALTPFLLLLLTAYLHTHHRLHAHLDVCSIQRATEPLPPTYIPLRDSALHNYSVLAIWAAMLLLLGLPARRLSALFSLLYTAQWFHVTYILLCGLKAPLEDFNCAGRHPFYPNGVSGHYCYFIFVSLSAPLLASARLQSTTARPLYIILPAALFFAFYAVGAPTTLYRTWAHGYHSLRQILLGSSLGLASHALLEAFFLSDVTREKSQVSRPYALAVLGAWSLTAFTTYYQLWPLSTAGPALTSGHLYFHGGLWALLAGIFALETFFRSPIRPKVATA